MKSFYECTRDEITGLLGRPLRATRAYQAVYQNRVDDFQRIELLPDRDRSILADQLSLLLPAVARVYDSDDGTRRYLLKLDDGELVESVFIPRPERFTLCVSSQVGCA